MRRLAFRGTEVADTCVGTIRQKPLEIGAVIVRNTRRVRVCESAPSCNIGAIRHRRPERRELV